MFTLGFYQIYRTIYKKVFKFVLKHGHFANSHLHIASDTRADKINSTLILITNHLLSYVNSDPTITIANRNATMAQAKL